MKVTDTAVTFTWKEQRNGISSLRRAKKLFAGGKRWITGAFKETYENGIHFCSIGAIREADGAGENIALAALNCALNKLGCVNADFYVDDTGIIMNYNDCTAEDYRDISKLFDSAMRILKRGEHKCI